MVVLPLLALAGLVTLCAAPGRSRSEAVLLGAVVWGVVLTALTEGANLAGVLTARGLAAGWAVVVALVAVALVRGGRLRSPRLPVVHRWRSAEGALLAGTALVLGATLLTALVAAPNNFDSLTYHLARVVHWAQNGTLAHYPTSIHRQLHHAPWAEFGLLHLHLLSGGDRFAALVQWGAMLGSVVGVAALARLLGGGPRTALIAAALTVAIPMGILQATSTQNDYVATFWLLAALYFSLLLARGAEGRPEGALALAAGAALGLATITKSTSYLLAAPFLLWIVVTYARRRGTAPLLRPLLIAAAPVLLLNAGHFARNLELYRWPLGPRYDSARYTNGTHSPAALASNVIRNIGLHTATPIGRVDLAQTAAVERIHDVLGIAPDDPRTTWQGTAFFVVGPSRHEDLAGNPLHLALLWAALGAMVLIPSARRGPAGGFAIALVGAFLLFCAYLKWQPWHSRLHLPLFVLGALLTAVVSSRVLSERRAMVVAGVVLLAGVPWVLLNELRPLVGARSVLVEPRLDQYFRYVSELREPYRAAARVVADAGCTRVGLATGENGLEYPLWRVMSETSGREVRIQHVAVANESRVLAEPGRVADDRLCAVIRLDALDPEQRFAVPRGYATALASGPVTVYLPRASTRVGGVS